MALINLQSFQFYSSTVRTCRSLGTLRKTLNHLSDQGRQLRSWCCGSSVFGTVLSRVRFRCVFYRNYHAELWNQPNSITGTVHLHRDAGNSSKSDGKWMDEQKFFMELNSFSSSNEIFKFLSSLEVISDTMAAAALQRICEFEVDDSGLKNPEDILENEVFRALCFQFEHESQKLSDTGLVTALQALIKLRVDPWSTLIVRLVSESQERLDKGQLTIRNLCILGESLLDLEGPGCTMLEQIVNQVQGKKLEEWTTEEIAMVYGMLQMSITEEGQYQDLLNHMNNITLTLAPQLSPKLISRILNALVILDQTQAIPLVIKLCKYSVRHVPRFTNDELANVLGAFIHFGHADQFFTEALERLVPKSSFTMHPETVSKVMQYCCRKLIRSKPIFDAVAESFAYNADKCTTRQIAEYIVPFGTLNYLPPSAPSVFRKLERILNARFTQFQPHTLLNLLHSCTLIERYPVNFLAKIFNPYFLQQLQAQTPGLDRFVLSQLTQLFLTVTLECPFYEGPKLLPKYRVKSFLIPGRSLESSVDVHLYNRVKTGLVDLLGTRMYFASHVLTPYCYTLDVEIKLDEEGFVLPATRYEEVHRRIALCIDGQKRFCSNNHSLLGKEAIKQRHLQLLGYEVVQIPFFEFETLGNNREIVEYLHKKIFPCTYRLNW
ncbi:FAST kinase domain-containing protein 3, mitochondrial isoform X1 [Chelonia mydas]|uniref:FAST kinase domain-containing protein 3, mitochondrial isoform X1 n=1 Tax=Chelonia mydas TaxID=8469 RepID=UPI0018A24160|nr:FAST kinase domain-containing protein 3, mitochondrial isoform X1 [Chelonia mydas]